jgi:hypothetical protein
MSNEMAEKKQRTTTTERDAAETVGQVLARVRGERRLSLSSAAIKTKIPLWYLSALEEGDHARLADDVYSRIWFKAYCTYLGLDAGRAFAAHQNERRRFSPHFEKQRIDRHPKTAVPASRTIDMPRMIRTTLLAGVAVTVAIYFVGSLKRIVAPPSITLSTPTDGFVTTQRSLSIEGRTEQEVTLVINGKQIAVDESGSFRDSIDLQEGLNTITVTGSKKHSKSMSVSRRVIVEPAERPTAFQVMPDGTEQPL